MGSEEDRGFRDTENPSANKLIPLPKSQELLARLVKSQREDLCGIPKGTVATLKQAEGISQRRSPYNRR